MKVIIEVEKLKELLKKSKNIINEKSMLTIIHNFYIKAEDNKFTVIATDLDSTIIINSEADVKENGEIVISKKLKETVDTMNTGTVTLVVKNNILKLYYGEDVFSIACINAEEFPRIIKDKEESLINIETKILKNMIYYTNFAASKESGIFTGINFVINKNENYIRMVGTDSHKLGMCEYKKGFNIMENFQRDIESFILPSKTLKNLNDILGNVDNIDISFKENSVIFMYDNIILSTKLMEGNYPNYNTIIPKDNENIAVIEKKELITKIERAKTLSESSQNKISINYKKDEIDIFSSNADIGSETSQKMIADYNGEDLNLVFSAIYLLELLKVVKDENIKFEMKSVYAPVIIKPNKIEEDMNILLLIMPLRLK